MAVLVPTTSTALRAVLRNVFGSAALLAAAACASGPSLERALTIEQGRRTTVRLMQFTEGRVFTLQNKSSGSAAEVYSDTRSDTMTKVVDDEMLQKLLDVFAERGLFASASSRAPAEADDAVIVEQGDRRFVFHRRAPGAAASYGEAMGYFLNVYNQAEAFHSSTIHLGDLRAERSRVQTDADTARRKLERLKGRGQ